MIKGHKNAKNKPTFFFAVELKLVSTIFIQPFPIVVSGIGTAFSKPRPHTEQA